MNNFHEANLALFTGTQQYYRLTPNVVLTDGTRYLADAAGAYWLMDAIASYLPQFTGREDFIVAKLVRSTSNCSAQLTLNDGNGRVLDQQHIEYTDFPITSIQLYACWGGEFWVIMLCSEY
jgi:hypothetical protein